MHFHLVVVDCIDQMTQYSFLLLGMEYLVAVWVVVVVVLLLVVVALLQVVYITFDVNICTFSLTFSYYNSHKLFQLVVWVSYQLVGLLL
jgi:hypothetical protein